jgi:hypothetical protein
VSASSCHKWISESVGRSVGRSVGQLATRNCNACLPTCAWVTPLKFNVVTLCRSRRCVSPRETLGCVLRHSYRVPINLSRFYTVFTNVTTEYVSRFSMSVCFNDTVSTGNVICTKSHYGYE